MRLEPLGSCERRHDHEHRISTVIVERDSDYTLACTTDAALGAALVLAALPNNWTTMP